MAVTSRSPPVQLYPRARVEQTCRLPCNRSRSSRKLSESDGGQPVSKRTMGAGLWATSTNDARARRCWLAVSEGGLRGISKHSHSATQQIVSNKHERTDWESPRIEVVEYELTVGKKPRVKTLRRLVLPQAPSPMMTSFLAARIR